MHMTNLIAPWASKIKTFCDVMNKKIKTIANGGLASHVLFYFLLLFCILFMLQITLLPVMEGPDIGC